MGVVLASLERSTLFSDRLIDLADDNISLDLGRCGVRLQQVTILVVIQC